MANKTVSLLDKVELALANAKRLRRDAGFVVVDLARIRDSIKDTDIEQSTQGGHIENGTKTD